MKEMADSSPQPSLPSQGSPGLTPALGHPNSLLFAQELQQETQEENHSQPNISADAQLP